MTDTSCTGNAYERRTIRDNLAVVGWVLAWMAAFVVSDKAVLYGWWSDGWLSWLSIALTTALGLWLIVRFLRLLRGMDELQRRIQLEALGLGLGLSLVGTITYSLLVTWGYVADEEVSDIFVLMCVSYSASLLVNVWRYR